MEPPILTIARGAAELFEKVQPALTSFVGGIIEAWRGKHSSGTENT